MKKLLPLLIILLILAISATIFISMAKDEQPVTLAKGNMEMKALDFKLNFTNDSHCKMLISTKINASQVATKSGKTWFFDDPACMIEWLQNKSFKASAKLWIYTIDTNKWIDAKSAWYGVTDKTAMHYGFGAREQKVEKTINYEEMVLRVLRGETLANPKIRKKLLGE
jgi:hypothetical protein